MASHSVEQPSVVAGLVRLRVQGGDYCYALLDLDPPVDEVSAYRHGEDHPCTPNCPR